MAATQAQIDEYAGHIVDSVCDGICDVTKVTFFDESILRDSFYYFVLGWMRAQPIGVSIDDDPIIVLRVYLAASKGINAKMQRMFMPFTEETTVEEIVAALVESMKKDCDAD